MLKIAHISDTHIRNQKYHVEYKIIFEKIYEKLRQSNIDIIIHTGDIAHTKTQLSPEYFSLCTDFFKKLSDIAPLYILPGNHDGILRNLDRLDAISPVIEALGSNKIHYSRDSVVYRHKGVNIFTWSLFDTNNWQYPVNTDEINICLYHGAVWGSKTDSNYQIKHSSDLNVDSFQGFDYALLGDIHKSNQAMDVDGKIRYAGSTIQQNFGETDDKGFLIWTIEGKDAFSVEQVIIPNIKPFVTIELNDDGTLPSNLNIKSSSKIRIISNISLSPDYIKKISSIVQDRFSPEFVSFVNKGNKKHQEKDTNYVLGNIRDVQTQNQLIREYFEGYNLPEMELQKLFKLNNQLNSDAVSNKTFHGVTWELLELEWDNLYNYGESNQIDFSNLEGIVGILGKNGLGKSSIFGSLLFSLFNSDSKPSRKNVHYVNQNKDYAVSSIKLRLGNKILHIKRDIKKYLKNLKGNVTEEAKITCDFFIEDENGNLQNQTKESRSLTDLEIQKYIGDLDSFLMSSMMSQDNFVNFIDCGPTKRKQAIARFLGLDVFEKKHEIAKEQKKKFEILIGDKTESHFSVKILELEQLLQENEDLGKLQKTHCEQYKQKIAIFKEQLERIQEKIETLKIKPLSLLSLKLDLENINNKIQKNSQRIKKQELTLSQSKVLLECQDKQLKIVNVLEKEQEHSLLDDKVRELEQIKIEYKQKNLNFKLKQKQVKLLKEVPCGDTYPQCKFIKDAWEIKEEINIIRDLLQELKLKKESLQQTPYKDLREKIKNEIKEHQTLKNNKLKLESTVYKSELKVNKLKSEFDSLLQEQESIQEQIDFYNDNKELYENSHHHHEIHKEIKKQIDVMSKEFVSCEAKYISLIKENGSFQQQLETLKQEKLDFSEYYSQLQYYSLLTKAYHPNGIPSYVINKQIPLINDEIAKILHEIVEFSIYLDSEGGKFQCYIKHPKYDYRPIEGAGGAEKAFADLVIRLSLLNVSQKPKSNIFILDEPGVNFDEKNLEGFVRILDVLKSYFKTIFLISHMDGLKDIVDVILEIDNNDGYAKVNI